MTNLLILTNKINYTDGVSSHLYYLLSGLRKTNQLRIFLICSGGDSIERFKNIGIEVHADENLDHQNRNLKNFTKAIISVVRFSRQNDVDIIHSHNHYAANIANHASKFLEIQTVQTIHGILPETGRLNHFKADKYVAVSEPVVSYLLSNKIASKKNIRLIRQGVPEFNDVHKDHNGEIKIISASRLVHEKGIDVFIKAARSVSEIYKNGVKFYIAGIGEAERDLKKLCADLNVDITFLGNVKNMTDLFSKSDIFVMPTRSGSEGFPMTIAEAASVKNLIIASKFDWLESIFKEGIDGLMFTIDDSRELSEKIIFALENRESADQMAENFYVKSQKIFSIGTAVKKHLELYNECKTT